MKAKCIENKMNNSNFTEDKVYEISETGIRCNWGGMWIKFSDWNRLQNLIVGAVFEFALCKFKIV